MRSPALAALAALFLASLGTTPARAAESYANCTGFVDTLPAVIATQGTWCLRADLATSLSSGAAITIATNNVTLDCNHFKLGGLSAGLATQARGIQAVLRLNLTVRNCNVRGFYRGIETNQGSGHVIEDNRFEANTVTGMTVISDNSVIRRNQVLDTGGSSVSVADALGIIVVGSDSHILDNLVAGVDPVDPTGIAYGIYYVSPTGGTIGRNAVNGMSSDPGSQLYGITASGYLVVYENTVQGVAGIPVSTGIFCASNATTARDNTLTQWNLAIGDCVASGNLVNPN